jgi:hypothetical protein
MAELEQLKAAAELIYMGSGIYLFGIYAGSWTLQAIGIYYEEEPDAI